MELKKKKKKKKKKMKKKKKKKKKKCVCLIIDDLQSSQATVKGMGWTFKFHSTTVASTHRSISSFQQSPASSLQSLISSRFAETFDFHVVATVSVVKCKWRGGDIQTLCFERESAGAYQMAGKVWRAVHHPTHTYSRGCLHLTTNYSICLKKKKNTVKTTKTNPLVMRCWNLIHYLVSFIRGKTLRKRTVDDMPYLITIPMIMSKHWWYPN